MAQVIVSGLLLGSGYALLAIGYTLVFGVTRLLTLAHGAVFMAAGITGVFAMRALHVPMAVGALVAVLAGATAGLATDALCFRPVRGDGHLAPAVATIGFGLILQYGIVALKGSEEPVGLPQGVGVADLHLGSVLISTAELATLIGAIVLMAAIHWFVHRARWGAAMRAMAESPATAELTGIDVRALRTATLAVSGAIAGFAGILVALRSGSANPLSGLDMGLIGLAIMTIGGIGSVTGAMVAGVAVGVLQQVAIYEGLGGYRSAIPWILVVTVLLVRPRGLFAKSRA